jgi:hypothetical protein
VAVLRALESVASVKAKKRRVGFTAYILREIQNMPRGELSK